MDLLPSPAILAGIIAAVLLPVVVALLSHGPWKIAAPGRRFHLAVALLTAGWVLFHLWDGSYNAADLCASLLIWLTAVLVEFSFWSLLAWGFTISLLLALARAGRPLTFDEWVARYTGGGTSATFAHDRLSLLFRFGFANREGDQVRLTPGWGPPLAWLVGILRWIFGVEA
jgi:hypothetical protein